MGGVSREQPTLDYAPPEKPTPGAVWQFIGRVVVSLLALALVSSFAAALVDLVVAPCPRRP
jgi:hypothetical protein